MARFPARKTAKESRERQSRRPGWGNWSGPLVGVTTDEDWELVVDPDHPLAHPILGEVDVVSPLTGAVTDNLPLDVLSVLHLTDVKTMHDAGSHATVGNAILLKSRQQRGRRTPRDFTEQRRAARSQPIRGHAVIRRCTRSRMQADLCRPEAVSCRRKADAGLSRRKRTHLSQPQTLRTSRTPQSVSSFSMGK